MESIQFSYEEQGLELSGLHYRVRELLRRSTGNSTMSEVLCNDLKLYLYGKLGVEEAKSLYNEGWSPEIIVGEEYVEVFLYPPLTSITKQRGF